MVLSREEQDRALYNSIAALYCRKDVVPSSALARKDKLFFALAPVLNLGRSLGVLVEIGCGVGATATYLQGRYDRYIGIDQSEELIIKARLLNSGIPHTEFIAANIKEQDLEPGCADLIFAGGVFHHMTELDRVMDSLRRLARPGAFLVVIEPQNSNPALGFARFVRGLLDPSYSRDQVFFSPAFLRDLFARHGMVNVAVDFHGYFSTPFAEVIMQPQFLFKPLAERAVAVDHRLARSLPPRLRRMSFNVVVSGRFS
ncbi:MAG: class I SAM-dependent methyltransferase [Desulfobacterales bacterium]|nr:class I SAM-dependent methyltransferase [Desulfobacterales bacterium]